MAYKWLDFSVGVNALVKGTNRKLTWNVYKRLLEQTVYPKHMQAALKDFSHTHTKGQSRGVFLTQRSCFSNGGGIYFQF